MRVLIMWGDPIFLCMRVFIRPSHYKLRDSGNFSMHFIKSVGTRALQWEVSELANLEIAHWHLSSRRDVLHHKPARQTQSKQHLDFKHQESKTTKTCERDKSDKIRYAFRRRSHSSSYLNNLNDGGLPVDRPVAGDQDLASVPRGPGHGRLPLQPSRRLRGLHPGMISNDATDLASQF